MNYASKGNFDLLDQEALKKADIDAYDRYRAIYRIFMPLVA